MSKRNTVVCLIAVFVLQFAFLIWVASDKIMVIIDKNAKMVLLETEQYEPYSVLSGHSLVVRPIINRSSDFKYDETITSDTKENTTIYATVVLDEKGVAKPDRFSCLKPVPGAAKDSIMLKAKFKKGNDSDRSSDTMGPDFDCKRFYCSQDEADVLSQRLSVQRIYKSEIALLCSLTKDLSTSEVMQIVLEHYNEMRTTESVCQFLKASKKERDKMTLTAKESDYDRNNAYALKRQNDNINQILSAVQKIGAAEGEIPKKEYLRLRVSENGSFVIDAFIIGDEIFKSRLSKSLKHRPR